MTTYILTRQDTGAQATVRVESLPSRVAYHVDCPWETTDRDTCAFSLTTQMFYCFGCGAYGTCREDDFL